MLYYILAPAGAGLLIALLAIYLDSLVDPSAIADAVHEHVKAEVAGHMDRQP